MTLDSSNVRVAVTGAWYVAPTSADAPTAADSALGDDYTDLGYLSSDGTTKSTDRSTSNITAWQNAAKVRTVVTDSGVSFQFVLIETTRDGVGLYTGSTVDENGKVSVDPGRTAGRRKFVLDVIDGDEIRRIYIPEGEVVQAPGDQSFTSGDAIGYDMTIDGYASAELDGDTYVEFIPGLATVEPVVATISTALPASKTTGDIVKLVGTGFQSTVSITVGGTDAPTFDVESDTVIYLTIPTVSSGSNPIIVTNAAGASSAKSYTTT
ncbi:MAG TPA: IPT/TIG domain-containing protein [Galbitalea sp.]|jgi:hypothetical protein